MKLTRYEQLTPLVGLFRFYPTEDVLADPFGTFYGVCTVMFPAAADEPVKLKGMHGRVTLKHMLDMALYINSLGYDIVIAERAKNKRLPLFEHQPDGTQLTSAKAWLERFGIED